MQRVASLGAMTSFIHLRISRTREQGTIDTLATAADPLESSPSLRDFLGEGDQYLDEPLPDLEWDLERD